MPILCGMTKDISLHPVFKTTTATWNHHAKFSTKLKLRIMVVKYFCCFLSKAFDVCPPCNSQRIEPHPALPHTLVPTRLLQLKKRPNYWNASCTLLREGTIIFITCHCRKKTAKNAKYKIRVDTSTFPHFCFRILHVACTEIMLIFCSGSDSIASRLWHSTRLNRKLSPPWLLSWKEALGKFDRHSLLPCHAHHKPRRWGFCAYQVLDHQSNSSWSRAGHPERHSN